MDGVKVDSLKTVKAMIIVNSDFCKDFYNFFTLYKDFLKQSDSTPSKTRRVWEVSSGGRGGNGGKRVKKSYYNKDGYSKLSRDNKGEVNRIRKKRGSNSGGEDHLNQNLKFGS